MNLQDFQATVSKLKEKAKGLTGRAADGTQLSAALIKDLDQILADSNDPEKMKAREAFYRRAEHDPVVKAQLSSIRIKTFNNFLMPSLRWIPFFFRINNLKADERPVYQNETKQVIRVGYLGANGTPRQAEIVKPQDETLIPLRWLATEEAIYKLVDINRGPIADTAQQTFDQAFEMANMEDSEAFKLVSSPVANGGVFGAFDLTNPKKNLWVYNPHPRVKSLNLPTTNDITMPGISGTSGVTYDMLDAALKYEAGWGGCFKDGDPRLTGRIVVGGRDITSLSAQIRPTGVTRNPVADELLTKGSAEVRYFGRLWSYEVNNTINPGAAYFEMDRKCGDIWYKQSLDQEHIEDGQDYKRRNEEGRWMQKPFAAACNLAERVFALRITYNSAYDPNNP